VCVEGLFTAAAGSADSMLMRSQCAEMIVCLRQVGGCRPRRRRSSRLQDEVCRASQGKKGVACVADCVGRWQSHQMLLPKNGATQNTASAT